MTGAEAQPQAHRNYTAGTTGPFELPVMLTMDSLPQRAHDYAR
jgi:hypothetical protein